MISATAAKTTIAITIATTTKGRPQRTSTATTAINKKHFGSQGGPDQFKQGNRDQDDQGGGGQRKQKDGGERPGGPDQFKHGNRDNFNKWRRRGQEEALR